MKKSKRSLADIIGMIIAIIVIFILVRAVLLWIV